MRDWKPISTFTDLSLVQCPANCTESLECLAVSFLASAKARQLLAIEEIISNNPFGVAFDSEDVTRFGTCELKSASDYADCDAIRLRLAYGDGLCEIGVFLAF